ncbi:MAG: DNA primase [Cyanobacteria bacterium P01_A01_bin.84]
MQIPALHPDTIEEVKRRVDICEVISDYVVLRKRGKDMIGLCPFHNEKTPSFTVSQEKQLYYCFGCLAAGNAITFLRNLEKRSFAEVVLDLAKRYQVPVQTLEPKQKQELQRQISIREQLYEVLAVTTQFYQHALQNSGGEALSYLKKQRQLEDTTIKQFALGYAPQGWETLYRYLVDTKRYPVALVEKAGLIKPRKQGSGYYDVFRDRVMVPIRDILGRTIAFGGRTLTDEQPKYLNSPETELFYKGKTLFALDQAKNAISQADRVVVVEGYFDAIALHQSGINDVVASLGTALSVEQIKLVLRYCDSKQLVLNFDADPAGMKATQRAIGAVADLAYKGEVQLKILNIPDGKDADEYLYTHSTEDYQKLLADAPLWIDWQIKEVIKDKDLKQVTDFQQASQKIVSLLKKIINKDTREYYVSYCAEILSLGEARLVPLRVENLLTQINSESSNQNWDNSSHQYPSSPTNNRNKYNNKFQYSYENSSRNRNTSKLVKETNARSLPEQAEALLLQIYLHHSEHRQIITNLLEERDLQFTFSHHRFLWRKIIESFENIQKEDIISTLQDKCCEYETEMSQISHLFHLNEKTQHEISKYIIQVVQTAIACMEKNLREKRYRHYLELWEQTDPEKEPEKYKSYCQAFYDEKNKLKELERQRQFSIVDLI